MFTLISIMLAGAAQAEDIPIELELFADTRVTISSGESSWFNNWLGKGRYGGTGAGDTITKARLAELSLMANADITWDIQAFAHLKYDPEQDMPVDIVEGYLQYKPVPNSRWRYEAKAGLFFPHISRENISVAWTSPYTITPSAINSWVGEEIRALGLEGKATYKGPNHRFSVTGAIFGFNDPAGTLLAFRGWGIGDAKVGAFGELPLAELPSIGLDSNFVRQPFWVRPVREIDDRPGFYAGLDWEYAGKLQAGVFYYDNRGDPEAIRNLQYAWDTKFWSFYAEGLAPGGIKLIAQYMTGNTKMGRIRRTKRYLDVDYDAGFLLASKAVGRYRFSARIDWFGTDDNSFEHYDNNNENGTAYTVAASIDIFKKDRLMLEYLHIGSDRAARPTIGFEAHQKNDIFQLSFRKRF